MKGKKKEEQLDLFQVLSALEQEHHIDQRELIDRVEQALLKAAMKAYPKAEDDDFRVEIDAAAHRFRVFMKKSVVPEANNDPYLVSYDVAKCYDPNVEMGDLIECPMDPVQFGRSIAQFVKQMIRSDLHEFSRKRITDLFKEKEKQLITVRVKQLDTGRGTVAVDYEGTELYLNKNEQIPNEILREGDLIQVLVTQIVNSEKKDKRPIVRISRSDRDIIRRLFERAVPEILDGTVTIHAVSREPGFRSKIAVSSNDPDVEAIGACIGPHGSRIDTVLQELHGEKIDIIPYSEDKTEFIIRALAPAKVTSATLGLDEHGKDMATVIVPDDQQSLAIGNRGLNAKLAAKLTDCKIDIKSESETVDREEEADFVEDMAEDTAEAAFDDAPIDFDVAEMDSTSAVE